VLVGISKETGTWTGSNCHCTCSKVELEAVEESSAPAAGYGTADVALLGAIAVADMSM
jgi:hypothetical protein